MKTSVAFYPYSSQFLPVVRHFDQLQDQYTLDKLYSLPGAGLNGKDASYACNHPPTGKIVSGEIDINDPGWTSIIIVSHQDEASESGNYVFNQIKRVLAAGKSVIFCGDSRALTSKRIEALKLQYRNQFIILTEEALSCKDVVAKVRHRQIDVPVILIGGLVESSDTLEILLEIDAELRRRDVCPSVLTKQPAGRLFRYHSYDSIFSLGLSEAEKTGRLNRFTKTIEREERPDVILIEAPDAVMRFNEIDPNGFGIRTYMLTQAIQIDYFVCSVPLELAVTPLLMALSNDFSKRLGSPIHAVQVSNIIVDSADMLQKHALSYVHSTLDRVEAKIEHETASSLIPLFDVVQNGAESLVECLGFCRRSLV